MQASKEQVKHSDGYRLYYVRVASIVSRKIDKQDRFDGGVAFERFRKVTPLNRSFDTSGPESYVGAL